MIEKEKFKNELKALEEYFASQKDLRGLEAAVKIRVIFCLLRMRRQQNKLRRNFCVLPQKKVSTNKYIPI